MEKTKKEELERLLMKTPLEKQTEFMFEILNLVSDDEIVAQDQSEQIDMCSMELVQFAKQVLAAIRDEPVKIGTTEITYANAIKSMKDSLISEYKRRYLNHRQMTYEEAKAVLVDWDTSPDINNNWFFPALADCGCIIDDDTPKSVIDDMVQDDDVIYGYVGMSDIEEDVTPEQVQRVIERWSSNKRKGRKFSQQNLKMRWVLSKIEMVYDGHTNSDFRLFFDCLDLFGLIDEQLKADWTGHYDKRQMENAKTKYMQSVYKLYDSDHGLMRTWNVILVDKNYQRVDVDICLRRFLKKQ